MSQPSIDPLLQELARKDFLTYQHSVSVADLMRRLAEALSLSQPEIQAAELLGAIHDIAKIRVPSEIFKKLQSGQNLNDEERVALRQNTSEIYSVIQKDLLPEVVQQALEHVHTRFDGKGRPAVAGEQIPLLSRMLSVTNYFDMLTRQRTGKSPLTEEQSRQVLEKNINIIFDPKLVELFLGQVVPKKK